jgi:hypothetical protein
MRVREYRRKLRKEQDKEWERDRLIEERIEEKQMKGRRLKGKNLLSIDN